MGKTIYAADLFCGAGGTSSGMVAAVEALGYDLELLAVNHWQIAIDTHSQNHSTSRHLCQTLDTIDPLKTVTGGRLNILVASPECIHHSNARGGKPMSDQSRASVWMVLNWLEKLYVDNVLIENVPEFESWGPLGANGRPLKSRKGELFQMFIKNLESLGYTVEHRVLNAADYGDATTRRRLFVMASRRKAISWPEPSHMSREKIAAATRQPALFARLSVQPWRAAREIIDWDIKGKSIFGRKKPLSANTLRRIYAGLEKFSGLSFIDDPLPTVTGTSSDMFLAQPYVVVFRQHADGRSVDEPLPALCAGGQHVGVAEPFVSTSSDMFLAQPYVVVLRQHADGRSVDEPLPTLCAGGQHVGVAEPFVMVYRNGQDAFSTDVPLNTLTTREQFGLISPFLAQHFGERDGQAPRVRSVDDPLWTVTTQERAGLIQPFLSRFNGNHAGRSDGANRNQSVDSPLTTLDTSNRFALVEPCILEDAAGRPITATGGYEVQYVIGRLDIRFRMLQPHELAAAMSFPKTYVFTGNREQKVKQIGNAVPCRLAQALCTSLLERPAKAVRKQAA